MPATRPLAPGVLAALAAAGLAIAVSGCRFTPGADSTADTTADTVSPSTPGPISTSTELPADFPDEIPLYDGPILLAVGGGTDSGRTTWTVTIRTRGRDASADIRSQLTEAGFVPPPLAIEVDNDEGWGNVFAAGNLEVLVTLVEGQGSQWDATYIVTLGGG